MKERLRNYLQTHGFGHFDLKAVIFDMDGVLYDSMPAHEKSWRQTMDERQLSSLPGEFYLHEGRTGKSTVDILFQRNLGRNATEEEARRIYVRKTELFQQYNTGALIPHAKETLEWVKRHGLKCVLVTGSGQPSLLERLDLNFPGIFSPETMVTAFDVIHGKPDPEPFLKGLQKAGDLLPNQAFVIENAPLGIKAATGAGIFTLAVNTGPLDDEMLLEAGASVVFDSMTSLYEKLPEMVDLFQSIRI